MFYFINSKQNIMSLSLLAGRTVICKISMFSLNPTQPQDNELFSTSTQLSMKFWLLIKTPYLKLKNCLTMKHSDVVFILLINVKMPAVVGILTFISSISSFSVHLSIKKVL